MISLHVKGFLFDMDGTLVDSTAVVENEWRKFSAQYDLDATEVIDYAHGRQTLDTVTHFIGAGEEASRATEALERDESTALAGIVAIPGAAVLLESIPLTAWALVTSAGRGLAESRMKAAGLPLPPVMICAEDVRKGKPDPEGYLKAAGLLGLHAEDCLVLEDAAAGIEAGLASGARVIAVNPRALGAAEAYGVAELLDISVRQAEGGYTIAFSNRA